MSNIVYKTEPKVDCDAARAVYRESGLGERRPIGDRERFEGMLRNANLIITAWEGALPVGIARSFTDFTYVTYLADLAVRLGRLETR